MLQDLSVLEHELVFCSFSLLNSIPLYEYKTYQMPRGSGPHPWVLQEQIIKGYTVSGQRQQASAWEILTQMSDPSRFTLKVRHDLNVWKMKKTHWHTTKPHGTQKMMGTCEILQEPHSSPNAKGKDVDTGLKDKNTEVQARLQNNESIIIFATWLCP